MKIIAENPKEDCITADSKVSSPEWQPYHTSFWPVAEGQSNTTDVKPQQTTTDAPETAILCGACGNPVTRAREKIDANGSHTHLFVNPHGIPFAIGCFQKAPGCQSIGPATSMNTWFRYYAWQIVVCAKCQIHLGWQYHSARDSFYGLILDRLIE